MVTKNSSTNKQAANHLEAKQLDVAQPVVEAGKKCWSSWLDL